MRRHLSTIGLIMLALAILAGTFLVAGGAEFGGTDSAATEAIQASHPAYQPWFHSVFQPKSAEVESGLFALQAALGAGVVGYILGRLRERAKHRASGDA
ncbi:MAG TPA: energy-coupling factor ABC transporter substrate-binding protein [Phycicoccus sp.]|nr:energy-coupling factor ABC transporter substrate-binding protein [Phycicoccus sp.]